MANVIVEGGAKGLYLLWGAPHVFRSQAQFDKVGKVADKKHYPVADLPEARQSDERGS